MAREEAEREEAAHNERKKIDGFWSKLTPDEKQKADAEALAEASDIQLEWMKKGGLTGKTTRQNLLDAYALSRLVGLKAI